MGKKSRGKGSGMNKMLGMLIGGVVIGGIAIYALPKVAPDIYNQINKASGGIVGQINGGITSGLGMIGIK
jgi:hypothetical protein